MLRVMSYNVRYFGHQVPFRGVFSTQKGMRKISQAIVGLERLPHVICLQEVETRSLRSTFSHTRGEKQQTQLEALMQILTAELKRQESPHNYQAFYFPAHVYSLKVAALYTTGLAVLVRDDLKIDTHNAQEPFDITHRAYRLTAKLKQSRICAHLRVGTPAGEDFDIFNTHLSLPSVIARVDSSDTGRMGYGQNQLQEIERLAEFIAAKKRSERYLLAGDFNALPGSPVYDLVQEKIHLHDPFPDLMATNVLDMRTAWPSCGFLNYRMRLDHIFAGPGLNFVDFQDTHPFGQKDGRWHGLSDHVPIVGSFVEA